MKFTKLPIDAFSELQLNAGIILSAFSPESGEYEREDIIAATTGGVNFSANTTYSDFGADIDNCPANTKELKRIDFVDAKMSGTFVTVNEDAVARLIAACSVSGGKVTPRHVLKDEDFKDLWWVGDYSDKTGEINGGYIAVHLINALSTGGFSIQSTKGKWSSFPFEFSGHYSVENPEVVPFEVYVKAGSEEV